MTMIATVDQRIAELRSERDRLNAMNDKSYLTAEIKLFNLVDSNMSYFPMISSLEDLRYSLQRQLNAGCFELDHMISQRYRNLMQRTCAQGKQHASFAQQQNYQLSQQQVALHPQHQAAELRQQQSAPPAQQPAYLVKRDSNHDVCKFCTEQSFAGTCPRCSQNFN